MQTFRKEFEAFYSLKSFYTPQLLKTNASVGYDSQDSKLIPHPFADTSPAHSLSQQDGLTIPSSIAEDSELLPPPFAEGVRGWGKSQIHSYQTKAFEGEKSYPLHCQSESLHSKAKESKRNPSLAMQTWNNKGTYEGKIMWNRISNELCFSYDWAGHYILDSMFMITTRNETLVKYLLSVLNSNISRHWIKNNAATLGEGVYGAKIYIEKLPIPKITKQNQTIVDKIIALVDEILESKATDSTTDTTDLEYKIDVLVYQLYNLTNEEIKIIESK
ncbi:TaqI-like C-terminal specificity domain-containing protein [Helicobacter mesocricetorum]|uniref:TaqI-like C-terminal specificity domain-containing protein n=1 Tax=Helicobacter mesocricetorum TaxID=87012 RepID=UPI000CF09DC4|nr:TaqI-like C-terminal specificity domain-containing protein [Helicobacter mesocricetorum]